MLATPVLGMGTVGLLPPEGIQQHLSYKPTLTKWLVGLKGENSGLDAAGGKGESMMTFCCHGKIKWSGSFNTNCISKVKISFLVCLI